MRLLSPRLLGCLFSLSCFAMNAAAQAHPSPHADWPTYGGDAGGQRYTAATQITPANLQKLKPAWTFHTGVLTQNRPGLAGSSFEATPILFHGSLLLTSPFDEVFSLDPATGKALWNFDPKLGDVSSAGILTSRGVAAWPLATDDAPLPANAAACSARVFVATMDARLMALDAATGKPCLDFGKQGTVSLLGDVGYKPHDPYFMTSPPTVVSDAVIVGSGIGDNRRVDIESGLVRAFDARTGKLLWKWEPLPWADRQKLRTGAGNAWSVIAADPEHNLVFVPTGAPSPDFYGGLRPGDNRDANSVVALDASTGRRVWGFQVTHHDLWDYDVAAEPLLFTWHGPDGKQNVPAIAINTKQGMVFELNRLTGEPLFPVDEKPVPKTDVPGETSSPTQPFQRVDSLAPLTIPGEDMLGMNAADNTECRQILSGLRYEGIYTPPTLGGSLQFPGNLGGVNWGSASVDPQTDVLYANTNRYAFIVQLQPRQTALDEYFSHWENPLYTFGGLALVLILGVGMVRRRSIYPGTTAMVLCVVVFGGAAIAFLVLNHQDQVALHQRSHSNTEHFGYEHSAQDETPYSIIRKPFRTAAGHPCAVMPFGTLSALNLNTGKLVFSSTLGTLNHIQPKTGTITLGGSLITASGLAFAAATREPLLRAFDSHTGSELWSAPLPVPAQATPMSYTWHGKQYVVIAAGGHGGFGTPIGDSLMAFALE
ncbi:MAG: pyrroloquinoline quinone-dependent dehydrogenase [Acidobacteriaceae bacterium]|nr:pyrroloquinoline quinone-dependent dehydrogenase [Acidobacteriaceae bacterium]